MVYHPTEDRLLGTLELARLCGFPDGYIWTKPWFGGTVAEIAKGVMPPIGRYFAGAFAAALDRGEPIAAGERWVVVRDAMSTRLSDFRPRNEQWRVA